MASFLVGKALRYLYGLAEYSLCFESVTSGSGPVALGGEVVGISL